MAPDDLKLEQSAAASRLSELISIGSSSSNCASENELNETNNNNSGQRSTSGQQMVSASSCEQAAAAAARQGQFLQAGELNGAEGVCDQQQQQRKLISSGKEVPLSLPERQKRTEGRTVYARYGSCDSTNQVVRQVQHSEARGGAEAEAIGKDKFSKSINQLMQHGGASSSSGSASTSDICSGGEEEEEEEAPLSTANNKPTALERLAKVIPGLGIIMALCASLFLGTAGMLVKLTTSVHGIQVAVFRALIQMLVCCVIILLRNRSTRSWLPARNEWLACTLRAILGGSSITFSYYALKLIPLGDATSIRFSLPIWTLIMSYVLLNESCSLFKICAVVISVCGVVLIAKADDCIYLFHALLAALNIESSDEFMLHKRDYDTFRMREFTSLIMKEDAATDAHAADYYQQAANYSSSPSSSLTVTSAAAAFEQLTTTTPLDAVDELQIVGQVDTMRQFEGCMMALASSICLSLSLIAMRLCKRTPAEVTILWLSVFSVLIGSTTLLLLNEWRLPDNLRDLFYIALNGICGSIGQWFITSALKVEQSGIIALARTFDIEIAFLYSALLLHEDIRTTSIIGSVLVSLGVIIVVVPKWLGTTNSESGSDTNANPTGQMSNSNSDSGGGGGGGGAELNYSKQSVLSPAAITVRVDATKLIINKS